MSAAVNPIATRPRVRVGTPFAYLAAIVVVGITIVPLLYVFVGGFRTNAQINADPTGLPSPWVWSNYSGILTSPIFWRFLENSVLIAVIATGVAVGVGSMASFALSRYTFHGREAFYGLF